MTERFDIHGPITPGVTVLEASAGTGKTYTIASLATREVADGLPLDQLLVVSFTRLSTRELRDRVRERLTTALRVVESAESQPAVAVGDELLDRLADASADVLASRRARLARAVAGFDGATIATTHQFCQEVLGGLGVAGDIDREYRFLDDPRDLADEVVGDLYVRGFLDHPPLFDFQEARRIAKLAIQNPTTEIAAIADTSEARWRRRLAVRVREEFDARKRHIAALTFDDLLTRLEALLRGDEGDAIAERLRRRYRVVLIDEFQDTDPVQWEIVRRAFGTPDGHLVLIGDPKQAVYAFRGADVYAYLTARREADVVHELDINWRSDQGLIDAYDSLFGDARLGHDEIVYRRVHAASANQEARLHDAPVPAPLRVRLVRRDLPSVGQSPKGHAQRSPAQSHVMRDMAAEIVSLLRSGMQIETRAADGTPTGAPHPVTPSDLAVLVRAGYEAERVRVALEAAGVPAVMVNSAGSVFATESARHWLRLLEALERPHLASRARSVALTPFLGWSVENVAGADDQQLDLVHQRLHRWAAVLRSEGVAALAETIMASEEMPARMLGHDASERDLTDLRHTAELLHVVAVDARLGVTALTAWLRRRIAAAKDDVGIDDRTRRLASEAAAVQVLTIHASKGLEFPIVYCPLLWEGRQGPKGLGIPVAFHDPARRDQRMIDVGLEGREYLQHRSEQWVEDQGEELRLAYVALTRARHQAVIWWAGTWQGRHSPLSRLVFARDAAGHVPHEGGTPPTDEAALERFNLLAAERPGSISVEAPEAPADLRWDPPAPPDVQLAAARLDRTLDAHWRRTSYSAITAGVPEPWVASEVDEAAGADDRAVVGPIAEPDAERSSPLHAIPSLLADLPAGARVGTFIHEVLEAIDVSASDIEAEIRRHIGAQLRRRRVDIGDPNQLAHGLRTALETPLGPLAGRARLRDLAPADRLSELTFELPLAGGDTPAGELTLDAIGAALDEHLALDDPLVGYVQRLVDPSLSRVLRGYLTGTIDVVARMEDGDHPRFAIMDYKSDRLTQTGEPLTAWHYRPAALAAVMVRDHYVLQALLYQVALHRYLRWRLPGYVPERYLAGVFYLFIRGMTGPDVPTVDGAACGVFAWRPPSALVLVLSDLLDRGGTT